MELPRYRLYRFPEATAITARYQDLTALWMDLWLQYHADPEFLVVHPSDEAILIAWFDSPQVRYEIDESGELVEQFPPPVPKKIVSLINPVTGREAAILCDPCQTRGFLAVSDASGPLAYLILSRKPTLGVPDA